MEKIIIEIISSQKTKHILHVFDKAEVRIGRGYNNDVVLLDPYVSGAHLCVRISDEGRLSVDDLNSRNGSFVLSRHGGLRGKQRIGKLTAIASGSSLLLGATVIRVFTSDHPVVPARRLHQHARTKVAARYKNTVWSALALFCLIFFIEDVLRNFYVDYSVGTMLFKQALLIAGLAIWAGVWTLVGRMIRHKVRFRAHFVTSCLFAVALIMSINLCGYAGFIFSDGRIESFSLAILGSILLATVLFWHMTYATLLSMRSRIISAVLIPALLCAFIWLGYLSVRDKFSPVPPHYTRLKPPFVRPIKVYEVDDFIKDTASVFEQARNNRE